MTIGISSNIHSNIAFPACTSNEYMKDASTLLPSLSDCINTENYTYSLLRSWPCLISSTSAPEGCNIIGEGKEKKEKINKSKRQIIKRHIKPNIPMEEKIPMFFKEINHLIIEDREALKMNVPTNLMEIEVQIPAARRYYQLSMNNMGRWVQTSINVYVHVCVCFVPISIHPFVCKYVRWTYENIWCR